MPRLCGRVDSDRIPRAVMLRTRDQKKQMSVARDLINVGAGTVLRTGGGGGMIQLLAARRPRRRGQHGEELALRDRGRRERQGRRRRRRDDVLFLGFAQGLLRR